MMMMWPPAPAASAICVLASVARLSSAAALPPSDAHVHGRETQEIHIASTIPLGIIKDFSTVTLKEAIEEPGLFDPGTLQEGASSAGPLGTSTGATTLGSGGPLINAAGDGGGGEGDLFSDPATTGATAATTAATAAAATCASPQTRIEWRNYTAADRRAFVDSIACLLQRPSAGAAYAPSASRYEDFVRVHQVLTPRVHHNGIFYPWHRYFVMVFEQALRAECGFDRAMPWWDETLDSGAFARSSLFTPDYFGSLPGPTGDSGTCVVDGRFANITLNIGPNMDNTPHCLSRAVDEAQTAQASKAYVDYCARQTVYGRFESCSESGPHAWGHNGIGSVMSDVYSSVGDPSFFMHHLFVDHQWAAWQEVDGTRKANVDGACGDDSNPCTPLTLQSVLDMQGLAQNLIVADVIDTQGAAACYRYDYYLS